VFVDFHLDQVVVRACVAPPYLALLELHPIEHAPGLAVEAVGELLRVGKTAADALDLSLFAADVGGRATVTGGLAFFTRTRSPTLKRRSGAGV
jgi:hypothetical protein